MIRSKRPFLPLYVADYHAETTHLSTIEHGAYYLLLLDYWRNGELPNDKGQLARIARMTPKEWAKISATIQALFGPRWSHPQLDALIQRASDKSEERRKAALIRHAGKHAIAPANAPAIGDRLQTTDYRQSPIQVSKGPFVGRKRGARPGVEDALDAGLDDAFSTWGKA
jgi:uncharacterized protein YdaU (DUF1376 family)